MAAGTFMGANRVFARARSPGWTKRGAGWWVAKWAMVGCRFHRRCARFAALGGAPTAVSTGSLHRQGRR